MTGLGDRLVCLGAAWLFARNTGRTLIADWRYGSYTPQSERNTYALCFESSHDLAGVPFVGDDSVAAIHLHLPRYPAFWNNSVMLAAPYLRPAGTIFPDRDAAVEMIRARGDVDAPTVIFDACVNDGLVSPEDSRTFLGAMRPTPRLRQIVTAFSEEYLGDADDLNPVHYRIGFDDRSLFVCHTRAPAAHLACSIGGFVGGSTSRGDRADPRLTTDDFALQEN
jgi:Nodulation protein Z (NodZ)